MYALSEMMGHAALRRGFYSPSVDIPPGIAGMEVCESLFTHLTKKGDYREVFSAPFARYRADFRES